MTKEKEDVDLEVLLGIIQTWQRVVDIMAAVISVPAGLIMRLTEPNSEVFPASQSKDNPYHPGERECLWG